MCRASASRSPVRSPSSPRPQPRRPVICIGSPCQDTNACNVRSTSNFLLAAALGLSAATAAASPENIGVVKRASGQVAIERDGIRIASPPGTELKPGDRLITGPDGYAQVKLAGTLPLSVSPDANIAIDRFAPGGTQPVQTGLL